MTAFYTRGFSQHPIIFSTNPYVIDSVQTAEWQSVLSGVISNNKASRKVNGRNHSVGNTESLARLPIYVTAAPYNADNTGATDASAAVAVAITAACASNRGAVEFPAGIYQFFSSIQPSCAVILRGEGMSSELVQSPSTLRFAAGIPGIVLTTGARNGGLEHLYIESQSASSGTDDGIICTDASSYKVFDVTIQNFGRDGLHLDSTAGGNCDVWDVIRLRSLGNRGNGIYIIGADSQKLTFYSPRVESNKGFGIYLERPGAAACTFYSVFSQANLLGAIKQNSGSSNFYDIYSEADTMPGATSFAGTGRNDATSGGGFTATSYTSDPSLTYCVKIAATGTPDTFVWGTDHCITFPNGPTVINGSNQALSNGITVKFSATNGHIVGDQWTIAAHPSVLLGPIAQYNTFTSPNYGAPTIGNAGGTTNTLFIGGIHHGTIYFDGTLNGNTTGSINQVSGVTSTGNIFAGTNSLLGWTSYGAGIARGDGLFLWRNNAQTSIASFYMGRVVMAKSGAYSIPFSESNAVYVNTAAFAPTLPAPVANMVYTFLVNSATAVSITASGGATIRDGATVSAANGTAVSSSVGDYITLLAVDARHWVVIGKAGSWTIT